MALSSINARISIPRLLGVIRCEKVEFPDKCIGGAISFDDVFSRLAQYRIVTVRQTSCESKYRAVRRITNNEAVYISGESGKSCLTGKL